MTASDPVTGQHRAEAWRVGHRFGWSCLDCSSGDEDVADAEAAERGAEWHSLHPHGLAAPEPVTGATQDQRLDALTALLAEQSPADRGNPVALAGHRMLARRLISASDAADAAAGIRRVPDTNRINTCGDLVQLALRTLADHLSQGEAPPGRNVGSAKYRRGFDAGVAMAVDTLRHAAALNEPGDAP